MAKKLYIFGIGGTGSRVIKSLAMLFAAGVKLDNGFDIVVPILIDPDIANGDLNRTKDILRLYQEIRNQVRDPDYFFAQELKTVNELANNNPNINPDFFQFKLNDIDSTTFGQYIGFDALSEDDKSFVKLLYSNSNLNSDLSVGFKGNPNMGSIVLNQFTNSQDFQRFGQTFGPDDAIFIINSIFGGTGAAGFPLLLKNLRGNDRLAHFAQIKDAPIGGLTYLPYFSLNRKDEINAESFEEKAKIAIDYYNRTIINQRKINVLHFIGNRGNTNAEEYAIGGAEQKNKAHFLEIAGALAIIEFCKNIGNYTCNNGQATRATETTEIKEFGIERDNEIISFDDLNISHKELLYKPLTKFWLFTKYLNEGLERAKNVSRWTKSNIKLVSKQKQSPCDSTYFDSAEYKNQILAFNQHFKDWIDELSKNKPAFSPFFDIVPNNLYTTIDAQNCLNIDNLKLRSEINRKTGKPYQIHTTLIKLFGISTENTYQKLSVRVNNDANRVIKVFRLHQGQEGTGWFLSAVIDKNALKTIKTQGKDVATSIPSPFARIDLVKSAFAWINHEVSQIISANLTENEKKQKIRKIIEGNTAHNKLISDALDVAQIFYKSKILKDRIRIIAWNPRQRFNDLINEPRINQKHQRFAETLKLFWDQDSVNPPALDDILYNFEYINRLYFIINRNTGQVIGGTSPATLFFAAPDASSAIQGLNIDFGGDRPFDDGYCPLHRRDVSFIEYFYALAAQNNNFSSYFPELNAYMQNIKNYLLEDNIRNIVANLTPNSISNYEKCYVLDDLHDHCEILNIFKIGTEKPLLSEKIIELPYTIDSSKFKTCGASKHLLPITKEYIQKYGINNIENYLRIEERAGGGVEAILDVPVQNGTLQYRKLYHQNDIVKLKVHLAILPFLKPRNAKIDYTIGIIDDRPDRSVNISLSCLNNGQEVQEIASPVVRNPGNEDVKSIYYKFTSPFDCVYFGIGTVHNIIIPKLIQCSENDSATFAIDFGTTNTHIEYTIRGNAPRPLDSDGIYPLWQSLMNKNDRNIDPVFIANEAKFEIEMMPYLISTQGSICKFPLRTAIVFNKDYKVSGNEPYRLFQHVNNFLLYEKRTAPKHYLKPDTQLKWSNYSKKEDEIKVSAYIEYLLTIVYYKALLLGANPSNTKIIWFYPVSMEGAENSGGELGIFIKLWKTAYKKVFNMDNTENLIQIPESVAPYLFYKPQVAGLSLSIDIGGGSSDIAVFDEKNENAILISSFKFAGNAIFGDGYSTQGERGNSDLNGWVNKFLNQAREIAGNEYIEILNDILERKDSTDFNNFLFSLENDQTRNFSYSRLIEKDKKLKLSILVFYGAIAYYSANLLKKAGINDIPKYILLSGTAAKTANIIDSSGPDNLINLASLFKHFFQRVYDNQIDRNIILRVSQNPKEITCKGALISGITESVTQNNIKFWLGGINDDIWGKSLDKERDVNNTPKYKDVDDNTQSNICDSIKNFYKLFDEFKNNMRFETMYLIDQAAYEKFIEIRENDLKDYFQRGLRAFHRNDDHHIEETLFFYPLIGILNKLTYELSKLID